MSWPAITFEKGPNCDYLVKVDGKEIGRAWKGRGNGYWFGLSIPGIYWTVRDTVSTRGGSPSVKAGRRKDLVHFVQLALEARS